ncbi:hypothetical protein BSKO_11707 [Bryopsis sp. KO-2023]|nr:hypothetical protein BSKO_11707 [Bryopsis sp. KO-2023]
MDEETRESPVYILMVSPPVISEEFADVVVVTVENKNAADQCKTHEIVARQWNDAGEIIIGSARMASSRGDFGISVSGGVVGPVDLCVETKDGAGLSPGVCLLVLPATVTDEVMNLAYVHLNPSDKTDSGYNRVTKLLEYFILNKKYRASQYLLKVAAKGGVEFHCSGEQLDVHDSDMDVEVLHTEAKYKTNQKTTQMNE